MLLDTSGLNRGEGAEEGEEEDEGGGGEGRRRRAEEGEEEGSFRLWRLIYA